MKIEREKSVDAIKCALDEAREGVRKSMEKEQEVCVKCCAELMPEKLRVCDADGVT